MTDKAYGKRFSAHPAFWIVCGGISVAIHIFFYFKIRAVTGPGWTSALWLGWSFAMMELVFLTRKTDKINSGLQRKWTDRLGGVWLLFVIIAFVIAIGTDILGKFTSFDAASSKQLPISFGLSTIIMLMGIRQANNIQTTCVTVATDKLPKGENNLRIVQLTDLHLGPWVGLPLLRQIVEKTIAANPDIVVVTGDLADGNLENREDELEILRKIKPRYGMFAVTGNHDYYDDIAAAEKFMESAGMKVLRSEGTEAGGILIVGADDRDHLEKKAWNLSASELLVLSFAKEQKEKFLLLLRHRPIIEPGTEGHFDLQLSGHTHGGQLFPYLNSRHIIAGHDRGLKKLKCGGCLYVSNGAGFVGPPVRLLAPPEIVVIDLINTAQKCETNSKGR